MSQEINLSTQPTLGNACTVAANNVVRTLAYEQDGVEAQEIAKYIPYFPFKGIDRFYDIGGFLYAPHIFQKIVDIFVQRYQAIGIDVIAGYVSDVVLPEYKFICTYISFVTLLDS
jgi:hypothetical protein